jgi:1,4-alpha-glucan branching enzyme
MKYCTMFLLIFFSIQLSAQTKVTLSPTFPTQTDKITITFDVTNATHQNKIAGYTGTVYAHTGVYFNNDKSSWQKVIGSWGNNTTQPQLTWVATNKYQLTIDNPRNFYSVTDASQKITQLCFVLRSSDGTKQTEDIFVSLYSGGLSVIVNSPAVSNSFGDLLRSPVFTSAGGTVLISVTISEVGTATKSIKLFVNNVLKNESSSNTLNYTFVANDYSAAKNEIKILATDGSAAKDSSVFVIMKNPTVKTLPLPSGVIPGINYTSSGIVLALYAPQKNFAYVISDYTSWKVDTTYFMNKSVPNPAKPDSVVWWINMPTITADPVTEVGYQYLVDGTLRIYDPYTEKVLDESNDKYISASVYPDLKAFPSGKTSGLVSVLGLSKPTFNWKISQFTRPAKEKLVIYELLIRDFVSTHSYKTLIDTISYFKKLGVNAIELMPISEFEGNDSWGYNPSTYFAPDKYYGTKNDLKTFIDACHQNGIAVIQDIVLNHAYNSNSMAQLYWDNTNNRPAANNPWFNVTSPNTSYSWGNDFNHESKDTKYFVDRVTSFWLTEYKVDGFRFDFTKGFTNTPGDGSAYDASRIAILKRMANKIWSVSPDAYVILEHFSANIEEMELANSGMMIWGNLNNNYSEATMGFISSSNFINVSYKQRGWSVPNLVGYMESHDEERLMYKNLQYGNSNGNYNIKNLATALGRMKLVYPFFVLVPGPKMIWQFGELGYDYSINYPSGTNNDRLTAKPIKWDYYSDSDRRQLFNTTAALIRLKKYYPVFSSSDYSLFTSGSVKQLYINDGSMNVAVFGNFDVTSQNYTMNFQNVGKWYEFFSGDSLTITNTALATTLQPGEYRLYTSKKIPTAATLVDVKKEETIPTAFVLNQNYPNPFNPSTIINWQIPRGSYVSLKVFDMLGREVASLVDEYKQAGSYNSQFAIVNYQLPSGIYFYRLHAGGFVSTKKMILIK